MNTYVVVQGDTLTSIAAANGTSVSALLALNPDITDPNLISIDQVINLPNSAASVVADVGASAATATPMPLNKILFGVAALMGVAALAMLAGESESSLHRGNPQSPESDSGEEALALAKQIRALTLEFNKMMAEADASSPELKLMIRKGADLCEEYQRKAGFAHKDCRVFTVARKLIGG